MNTRHSPNVANLKAQARRYRASHIAQGRTLSHSRALELVARQQGFADWNTAVASCRQHPVPTKLAAGKVVQGRYLGHAFDAHIVAATQLADGHVHLTLDFNEAIDVSASSRFRAVRKRISGTVDSAGRSVESLSDGTPQLQVAGL